MNIYLYFPSKNFYFSRTFPKAIINPQLRLTQPQAVKGFRLNIAQLATNSISQNV